MAAVRRAFLVEVFWLFAYLLYVSHGLPNAFDTQLTASGGSSLPSASFEGEGSNRNYFCSRVYHTTCMSDVCQQTEEICPQEQQYPCIRHLFSAYVVQLVGRRLRHSTTLQTQAEYSRHTNQHQHASASCHIPTATQNTVRKLSQQHCKCPATRDLDQPYLCQEPSCHTTPAWQAAFCALSDRRGHQVRSQSCLHAAA